MPLLHDGCEARKPYFALCQCGFLVIRQSLGSMAMHDTSERGIDHVWIETSTRGKLLAKVLRTGVRPLLQKMGVDLVRYHPYPPDFSPLSRDIIPRVKPFTMTGQDRINALVEAVRYVVTNGIPGAMVECGVWRGGSCMAMALALKQLGDETRELWLYDTYAGMNAPGAKDVSIYGKAADEELSETRKQAGDSIWCLASLDDVRSNVLGTGYPAERVHFIEGMVERTIPARMPDRIALLRLDTDWYESTRHELTHLFPLLAPNGVLIIDDYGHWEGQRRAVDEYIAEHKLCAFLSRIDYTARLMIKNG
jgi:O-methyltransferase